MEKKVKNKMIKIEEFSVKEVNVQNFGFMNLHEDFKMISNVDRTTLDG